MVAFLGFLQQVRVGFQFFRFFPHSAINALQHGVFFIPAPICAGDIQQFERFGMDFAGPLNMRSAAQVDEIVMFVNAQFLFFADRHAVLILRAGFQVVDQFQFEGLVFEKLAVLLCVHDFLCERDDRL